MEMKNRIFVKNLFNEKIKRIFDKKALYDRNKGLVDMANMLDELSIPFMLSDGVLLGAVRDGALYRGTGTLNYQSKLKKMMKSECCLKA